MVNVNRWFGRPTASTPAAESETPSPAPAAPPPPAAAAPAPAPAEKPAAKKAPAAKPRGDIRLFAFPDYSPSNPYQTGLYSALAKAGDYSYGTIQEAIAALATETRQVVYHLHWPEPLFAGSADIHDYQAKADEFLSAVRLFKAGGGLFVWTIHNVVSHDRRLGDFEVEFSARLSEAASLIHLHSEAAIEAVNAVYPVDPAKVVVVPHGSYLGYYPPAMPRDRARWLLGVPEDAFVFAFVGQLRPYKGIDVLLAAFEEVVRSHPNAYLVVAGKPVAPFSAGSVKLLADMNPNLRVLTGFLPPHDLARICAAADAIVLPYRQILTSGSVLLAASYAKPVIVPSSPTLRFVAEEQIGIAYDPAAPDGLRQAMLVALAAPEDVAKSGVRSAEFARRNAWSVHGESFLQKLRQAMPAERLTIETDGRKRPILVHRRTRKAAGAIGIALVNYFSVDDIERLTAELPKSVGGRAVRVYVYDNAAGQRPNRNLMERVDVYAYDGDNQGYAGGNNALLELMRQEGCEYGFIVNPDVAVTAAALDILVRNARPDAVIAPAVMNADGRVGYGGGVAFAGPEGVVVNQLFEGGTAAALPKTPYEVDVLNGCALFVPLALLPKIGHIPEDYFLYYEETHWCLSFKDRGVKCVVVPDARVSHNKRSKAGDFPALYYTYYLLRNRFVFSERWGKRLGGGYDAAAVAAGIERDFVQPWQDKILQSNAGLLRVFERCVAAALEDGAKGVSGRVDLPKRLDDVTLKETAVTEGRLEVFGGGNVRGWVAEKGENGKWGPGQVWVFRDGSPVRAIDVTDDRADVEGAGFARKSGFRAPVSFASEDGEAHQFELRTRGDGRRILGLDETARPLTDLPVLEKRPVQHKAAFGNVVAGRLNGWAYDAAHPGVATLLDISVGTETVVRGVRADIWRADLEKAKIGAGDHAFQVALPNDVFKHLALEATACAAGRTDVLAKRQISIVNPSRGFSKTFDFEQFLRWSYNEERMPYGQVEEIPAILDAITLERMLRIARSEKAPQTDLVSVVMPVFNREKIVAEAIQSVLAQTYANFEFLIVDDGSADDSVAVIKSFDDPRIRLIELAQNSGVSAARNAGLREARGPFIAYIDSDNVWSPHYLAVMLDALRGAPETTTAYAGQEIWEYLAHYDRDEFRFLRMAPFNRSRLERRNFIDLNVFMHRRELYDELGGFNESMRRLVDWELILRYTERRPPVFLPVTLGRYRIARADNQITFVEDHLANLALLRLPTPLTDLRVADDAPAPPLAVFVHARDAQAYEQWRKANRALVAGCRHLAAAWPKGGGESGGEGSAEGIGPDGEPTAFPSVAAALAAHCDGLSDGPLLLVDAEYVLSGRWKQVYAAASAEGRFDALTGRLYTAQPAPDGAIVFEDQMTLKIAHAIRAWQFSPRMQGVAAASLPPDYLIFPPASLARLTVCARLESALPGAVTRFFGYAAEGPMIGLYAPDLSAFAIRDIPFQL
ncbi:GT2 family glycosyltransferase/glycosyltransferase involved in cell wall biosynthesis [Methylorubrum rhodinum]|uniref:GT2 family glycosyltransferase/glycosyltransferase involved in cell wall biosynthesis n=1 Tax=Methylorubrum rhodinum TaxID=29428 RepID=A0A840ZHD5_9HYPH|nr:glycosyltransferase [Methylorubrum rhodinum]MBB5756976.1 GT2 family glycosyltransferase/glycosyltransferase involved in cell wall biosynthesis [Methylorubrum rhodinum]